MNIKVPLVCLKIQPIYFELIKAGKKEVEGRLNKPNLAHLKSGNIVRFQEDTQLATHRTLDVKISYLKSYPTFYEMLAQEGLHRCLPDASDVNEGVKLYYSFPSYQEKEKEYGVLALGIELLTSSFTQRDPHGSSQF